MSTSSPKHTRKINSLLKQIKVERDAMLKLGVGIYGNKGASMFPLDFMAIGAIKRNISTASAFCLMIESWNMTCARTLLRTHIDTSLRFSAAWLVEKPHEFATNVLKGERIDKMKAKNGMHLRDAYLVKVRSFEHAWLPDVYERLSGYIHFSGSHIYDSVTNLDNLDNTISFEISEKDLKFPESSWIELLECFCETNAILAKFLNGYIVTKQLSQEELEALRDSQT